MPLILHGEPVLGLEAAAASLITPDDVVLNLASGVYGKGFGYWAKRYSPNLLEIEVPYNEAIDPQAVADMLKKHPEITHRLRLPPRHAFGHDQPDQRDRCAGLGAWRLPHRRRRLVLRRHGYASRRLQGRHLRHRPGKCLGAPPALTVMGVSDRAWAKMKANPLAPRASMLSIVDWENAWSKDKPFPFTPSVAEMNGLDAALDLYLTEGPEAVWARHALTAKAMRAGVRGHGPVGVGGHRTISLRRRRPRCARRTASTRRSCASRCARRYGVVLSSGRSETLGKLTRIGHMGPTAQPIYAIVALTALGGALNAAGGHYDIGKGVEAALAVIDADA